MLHVDERRVAQLRTRELEHARVRIDLHGRQLLKTVREIQISIRIIDHPAHPTETAPTASPVTATKSTAFGWSRRIRPENDSSKRKHVLLEPARIRPLRQRYTVRHGFPRRADRVFV